jgi:hypothetical protein
MTMSVTAAHEGLLAQASTQITTHLRLARVWVPSLRQHRGGPGGHLLKVFPGKGTGLCMQQSWKLPWVLLESLLQDWRGVCRKTTGLCVEELNGSLALAARLTREPQLPP